MNGELFQCGKFQPYVSAMDLPPGNLSTNAASIAAANDLCYWGTHYQSPEAAAAAFNTTNSGNVSRIAMPLMSNVANIGRL